MTVELDPITAEEVDKVIETEFNEIVNAMQKDGMDFDTLSFDDIAELFFANGFLRGCMAMTENEDLKETMSLVSEEIEYQKLHKQHK